MISSSAEFAAAAGACAIVIESDPMGGEGGRSKTTVTRSPSTTQFSSRATNATIAPCRSFHQPSGRDPITFIASTIQCTSRR